MAISSTRTVAIGGEFVTPAPKYLLPRTFGIADHDQRLHQNPAWSLGIKTQPPVDNMKPGPGYNIGDKVTSKGIQNKPAFSITGRSKDSSYEVTPGPGHYDGLSRQGTMSHESNPHKKTMGSRDAVYKIKTFGSSPNAYHVGGGIGDMTAISKNSARWSMYGQRDYGSSHYAGCHVQKSHPGPAAYSAVDPSVQKKRPYSYLLQGRTDRKVYNSAIESPSPNSYNPNPAKRNSGCFLGVKHSPHTVMCLTKADTLFI